ITGVAISIVAATRPSESFLQFIIWLLHMYVGANDAGKGTFRYRSQVTVRSALRVPRNPRPHAAWYPPSITCEAPVMNDALSEHIQATASAISLGTPKRRIGTFARISWPRSSIVSFVIAVAT